MNAVGALFLVMALSRGKASIVAPTTNALAPVLTVLIFTKILAGYGTEILAGYYSLFSNLPLDGFVTHARPGRGFAAWPRGSNTRSFSTCSAWGTAIEFGAADARRGRKPPG